MFYIDQSTPEFLNARDEHYKCVRYVIKKKLLGNKFTEPHPTGLTQRISQATGIDSTVAAFFKDDNNLRNLLIGTPGILDGLKDKFKTKKNLKSIAALIQYNSFLKTKDDQTFRFYNAYHLATNLNASTCIYCNRLYTHTIVTKNEFIARPTFDHWYPKSKFPILALSFYNLIPSCNVCNSSVKLSSVYNLRDQFHPYLKHPLSKDQMNFKFSFDLEDHIRAKCVLRGANPFTRRSLNAMKLKEMYSLHTDEIRELIYLKKAYSQSYLGSLRKLLNLTLTDSEMYKLAFGVMWEDEHLHLRPLSKLKKDILVELGIAK